MINPRKTIQWELPTTPEVHPIEHKRDEIIEGAILELAQSIVKHGVYFNHGFSFENLIDDLHESIEDNIEKFLPDGDYDV